MLEQNQLLQEIKERLTRLAINMEKMKLAEYVDLLEHPWRLMYINFISGIARGFGIAIGFAILGAIVLFILQRLALLHLPVIGNFIAEIVRIVERQLGR